MDRFAALFFSITLALVTPSALAQSMAYSTRITGGTIYIMEYTSLMGMDFDNVNFVLYPGVQNELAQLVSSRLNKCSFDPPLSEWAGRVSMRENMIDDKPQFPSRGEQGQ